MKVLVRHRVVMLGLLAVGLCAGAADHEVLTWKSGDNWLEGVWTDAGGNEVTWTDGSIARTYGQNIGANKSCEVTA